MIKTALIYLLGLGNPFKRLEDGRLLRHSDYSEMKTPKNWELKIARNVISQDIINKEDFIDFVNEYADKAQTKIFYTERYIKAILNYPTKDKADHADSVIRMSLSYTKDFEHFESSIDTEINQKSFIRLLKRLEPYIIAFDGKKTEDMDIIEAAENLQASTNFTSVQRNTSNAFMFDAEVKTGKTNFVLPRYITFELPIYKNDLELTAQFDVELFLDAKDNQFTATLACYKFEQLLDEAVRELTEDVCEKCEQIKSFKA